MRLRRVIVSALLVITLIGGLQILPVSAASTPSTSANANTQASSQSQADQQGLSFGALTNLLHQISVSGGQASPSSSTSASNAQNFYNLLKQIYGLRGSNPGGGGSTPLSNTLLAKAQPDACYGVISGTATNPTEVYDKPTYNPQDGTCPTAATAGTQANPVPKTDQAYVWGLTQSPATNDLWFGTMANTQCLVEGSYFGTTIVPTASANQNAVCEFGVTGDPTNALPQPLPPALGDWRPPHIYYYDLGTGHLTDTQTGNPTLAYDLSHTLGLRSAGSVGNYVLLAGPSVTNNSVNVFVFTANDHAFQGMIQMSQYNNIRKWLTYNGQLYTAMHLKAPALGGDVLKWTPDPNNLTDPSAFTVVGHVNGDPAELAVFENKMFVSTWPDPNALSQLMGSLSANSASVSSLTANPSLLPVAGLWMSPAFSGQLPQSSALWSEPWNVLDYEPDPVTALTYGGGAISVYDGQLYWGTMHVPGVSSLFHAEIYGTGILPNPQDTAALTQLFKNSERAIAIFRGSNFGQSNQNVQLLYGERTEPVWIPNSLTNIKGPGNWYNLPTKAGRPLYGASGFGNPYNNYTWSMAVYKGSLYIGTMDWSMLAGQAGGTGLGLPISASSSLYGADLWKFTSGRSPAVAVNTTGVGNPYNYGIRNMITGTDASGASALFLGMANPFNLAQALVNGNMQPVGGWELRELK